MELVVIIEHKIRNTLPRRRSLVIFYDVWGLDGKLDKKKRQDSEQFRNKCIMILQRIDR